MEYIIYECVYTNIKNNFFNNFDFLRLKKWEVLVLDNTLFVQILKLSLFDP